MTKTENYTLEDINCPLGCQRDDDYLFSGGDRLHGHPGTFNVVECRHCGLIRTNPRPTADTIGTFYPHDYAPYLGTYVSSTGSHNSSALKKILKQFSSRIFQFNTSRLPRLVPGRMLEIGCASGSFMHHMAEKGWQVEGIEFSPEAAGNVSRLGYKVHAGALETAPPPEKPYDLIVGWMVLEHLHDPVNCLKRLRQWSTDGAWMVLSVPNAGAIEFNLFKDAWYALQLPTHLHHFSPESLEKVLHKAGWNLVKVFHQRVISNLIASTGYVLRDKGFHRIGTKLINFPNSSGYWNYVLYPLSLILSLLGHTGRITIWAKPISADSKCGDQV